MEEAVLAAAVHVGKEVGVDTAAAAVVAVAIVVAAATVAAVSGRLLPVVVALRRPVAPRPAVVAPLPLVVSATAVAAVATVLVAVSAVLLLVAVVPPLSCRRPVDDALRPPGASVPFRAVFVLALRVVGVAVAVLLPPDGVARHQRRVDAVVRLLRPPGDGRWWENGTVCAAREEVAVAVVAVVLLVHTVSGTRYVPILPVPFHVW